MFANIGKKIKVLAKVLCWVGIVLSVAVGLLLMFGASKLKEFGFDGLASKSDILGLLIIVIGTLVSWIGSFFTYGFGELIDTNQTIAQCSMGIEQSNQRIAQCAMRMEQSNQEIAQCAMRMKQTDANNQ